MKRFAFLAALLLPFGTLAAGADAPSQPPYAAQPLFVATSSPGNAYIGGASVIVTTPTTGDLSVVGGTVLLAAPVGTDALIFAGSASTRTPITGDLRAVVGHLAIEKSVGGDLAALGASIKEGGHVGGSVFLAAIDAEAVGGADGPVTIYGNTVTLGGDFAQEVRVVAADRLTLEPGTRIRGPLTYQAPLAAAIPAGAVIEGGVHYTQATYLPGAQVSKTLAYASIGLFLVARVLAALVLTGLVAGLFPLLAEAVVSEAYEARTRHFLLTALLGFAAAVVTPIMILLLALTFVGLGLAVLLAIAYAALILLALVYAGVLAGGVFARRILHRETVRWTDAVIGTLALSLLALVPLIGPLVLFALASFTAGALLLIFFRTAFTHPDEDALL